jgi:hypothetical protein
VQHEARWRIEVPDLKVALETRSAVERLRLGFWQLLDGGLPAAVREKLTVDVTDRVEAARAQVLARLDKIIEGGAGRLVVKPRTLTPGRVRSGPGYLAVDVRLVASAELVLP